MVDGMDTMKIGLLWAESTSARAAGMAIDVSVERVGLLLFLLLSGECCRAEADEGNHGAHVVMRDGDEENKKRVR